MSEQVKMPIFRSLSLSLLTRTTHEKHYSNITFDTLKGSFKAEYVPVNKRSEPLKRVDNVGKSYVSGRNSDGDYRLWSVARSRKQKVCADTDDCNT